VSSPPQAEAPSSTVLTAAKIELAIKKLTTAVAKIKLATRKNPPTEIQTSAPIPPETALISVVKNNVIFFINEPGLVSSQKATYKEIPEQHEVKVTPSPISLPPTTKVPARSGKAWVKKIDFGKKLIKINRSVTLKDGP